VTPDGEVKVLDFGLAKAHEREEAGGRFLLFGSADPQTAASIRRQRLTCGLCLLKTDISERTA
jgi:hypothetical protein